MFSGVRGYVLILGVGVFGLVREVGLVGGCDLFRVRRSSVWECFY